MYVYRRLKHLDQGYVRFGNCVLISLHVVEEHGIISAEI